MNLLQRPLRAAGLIIILNLAPVGCSDRPSPPDLPAIAPDDVAQQAIEQYDTNSDGYLDAKELQRCPALLSALKEIDTDKDGRLSATEISERLASLQIRGIALLAVTCKVTLDDQPLHGATVTFVPEKFMGSKFRPAFGVTDAKGLTQLRQEGQGYPGAQWGYYRIEVSKKDGGGKEMLPARYNSASTLGREITGGRQGTIVLNLYTE